MFLDFLILLIGFYVDDPVVNVRRKVIELMPELSARAEDPAGLQKIEDTFIQSKKSETDRDAKEAIGITYEKLRVKCQDYK